MKALQTIIRPIVTEKAIKMGEKMKYPFYVHKNATKIDIKQAIKELYGHDVATVRIARTPAKTRGSRNMIVTKRPEMKKAIVTLKGGKKIDITKVAKEKKK